MSAEPDRRALAEELAQLAQADPHVAVVGSINADLTVTVQRLPHGGETVAGSPLRILPGGKSANQAATAARLGAATALVGAVGEDPNGTLLLKALQDAGVDTTAVARVAAATGTAMIVVDDAAENFIVISAGANAYVDADMVRAQRSLIERAGALGLCLEVNDEAVMAAAQLAREAGVRVVFNLSPIRSVPSELLRLVDVLIVNEHELAALVGAEAASAGVEQGQWEAAAARLATDFAIADVVVTMGGEGSVVLDIDSSGAVRATAIPAVPVEVVDTTGAGDSYMGTLLTSLAAGKTVLEGARLASLVSAYATTGVGAQSSYGSAAQVADFARSS